MSTVAPSTSSHCSRSRGSSSRRRSASMAFASRDASAPWLKMSSPSASSASKLWSMTCVTGPARAALIHSRTP
ncbi:MAG: hypothetical protein IPJ65_22680 [Archangiaceae bacterium]|nr:hypothetical protein [Archangiaceae bacterium]